MTQQDEKKIGTDSREEPILTRPEFWAHPLVHAPHLIAAPQPHPQLHSAFPLREAGRLAWGHTHFPGPPLVWKRTPFIGGVYQLLLNPKPLCSRPFPLSLLPSQEQLRMIPGGLTEAKPATPEVQEIVDKVSRGVFRKKFDPKSNLHHWVHNLSLC